MKRDETVYLRHILDATAKVEIYLDNVDEASFRAGSLIQNGVIRQTEIIGEANPSGAPQSLHPDPLG